MYNVKTIDVSIKILAKESLSLLIKRSFYKKMLSQDVIRQLSSGSDKEYIFDFSLIPSDRYEPLFRTLQKFCVTPNVEIIGFNCDALAQIKDQDRIPPDIKNSIAKHKKSYVRNIVELLYFCVPKSKYITEVRFSNLVIPHDNFTRLCTAFARSLSFKKLSVQSCTIQDSSVDSLFRTFDPNKVNTIILERCGLSSSVITPALAFIRRKTVPDTEGIQTISFFGNEIPNSELQKIENALNPTKMLQDAIRTAASVPQNQKVSETGEERAIDSHQEEILFEIESLRNENQMLRNQIKALKEMKASSELNGSIFVVGTGSPQFVSYLSEVEEKLIEIDQNTCFMPKKMN